MTDYSENKSRTTIKKEAIELQKTGEKLMALTKTQLTGIDIPDELKTAIIEAKSISSFKARQRQKQFIGALMRQTDIEPIEKALRCIEDGISISKKQPSMALAWHEAILAGNNQVETEIMEKNPDADRQRLRQLVRNAHKKDSKSTKSSVRLLNYLKELSG